MNLKKTVMCLAGLPILFLFNNMSWIAPSSLEEASVKVEQSEYISINKKNANGEFGLKGRKIISTHLKMVAQMIIYKLKLKNCESLNRVIPAQSGRYTFVIDQKKKIKFCISSGVTASLIN